MAAARFGWSSLFKRNTVPILKSPSVTYRRTLTRFVASPIKPHSRLSVRYASQYPWPGPRNQYSRFGDSNQGYGPVSRIGSIWNNYRTTIIVIGGVCVVVYVSNLETVQISGRRRFNIVSPEMEAQIFKGQYEQMVQELRPNLLPASHPATRLAHRVVSRLVHANGLEAQKWVIHVVQDEQANAFCMPGGQIFVFTGILPYTQDEEGLAAVLGHEMAHKVARHHAEQLSGRIWAFVFVIAAALLGDISSNYSQFVYNLMFDLRNSRTQEAEADQLGLLMMAKSCYDPRSAVTYWKRMVKMEQDKHQSVPQFLSTHPASESRVHHIEALIPEAMKEAEESGCSYTRGRLQDFRETYMNLRGPIGQTADEDWV